MDLSHPTRLDLCTRGEYGWHLAVDGTGKLAMDPKEDDLALHVVRQDIGLALPLPRKTNNLLRLLNEFQSLDPISAVVIHGKNIKGSSPGQLLHNSYMLPPMMSKSNHHTILGLDICPSCKCRVQITRFNILKVIFSDISRRRMGVSYAPASLLGSPPLVAPLRFPILSTWMSL